MTCLRLCGGLLLLSCATAYEDGREGAAEGACDADAGGDLPLNDVQLLQVQVNLHENLRRGQQERRQELHLAQRAETRHAEARAEAEDCSCYNWKDVYANKGVQCGLGNEVVVAEAGGAPDLTKLEALLPKVQWDFCETFYEVLDTAQCTSIDYLGSPTGWKAGTWCYVSARCSDLGMGAAVPGTEVAWKTCSEQDLQLRNWTVPQLMLMAQRQDLLVGLLVKMAYPNVANGMEMSLAKQVMMQQDLQTPMVFDSGDHHPPFHVVTEKNIYAVRMARESQANMSHPSSLVTITCVSGCSLSAEVAAISVIRSF